MLLFFTETKGLFFDSSPMAVALAHFSLLHYDWDHFFSFDDDDAAAAAADGHQCIEVLALKL